MNKAILYQPWGGLGDNLQFTSLPEMYHQIGIDFYVNKDNVCRNDEITKLVWETNPYFKGYTDESPTCGSVFRYYYIYDNMIMNWEQIHGFTPKNKTPKMYWFSEPIDYLKDKVVLSLQSISADFSQELFDIKLKNFLKDISENNIIVLKYNNNVNVNKTMDKETKNFSSIYKNLYEINNIFDLSSVILSCDHLITTHSGASVLASAYNKKTTVFISNKLLLEFKFSKNINTTSGDYLFQNINYIAV